MKQARRSHLVFRSLLAGVLLAGALGLNAGRMPANADAGFADPAFKQVWERTDAQVAQGEVKRSWLWGPQPGTAVREPWADSPGGTHIVQYFDKGRMEINDPAADPNNPFFVTNGLLAFELVSGRQQVSRAGYVSRAPAQLPVAGDSDDPQAPTYASFRPVTNLPGDEHRAGDETGRPVKAALTRDGQAQALQAGRSDYGVRNAYYEPQTGHNVPDVFWTFLNASGSVLKGGQAATEPLFSPWFVAVGLPLSEAYWSQVKIAGREADVLVQVFQRRVLTYTPSNSEGFQVEMGNIGLHYVQWRYGGARSSLVRVTAIAHAQGGINLNIQSVTLHNYSATAVDMTNWQIATPKAGRSDTYAFPRFTLPKGGTVTVYAGSGESDADRLYMGRITWFFDATPYDGVVLYDVEAREVTRYFLVDGVPPTPEPLPTELPTLGPASTPGLPPGATATTPAQSGPTNTPYPYISPTPNGTATPTPSYLPTGTPTPSAFDDTTTLTAWVDNPSPKEGAEVTLYIKVFNHGEPALYSSVASIWHFPGRDALCQTTTNLEGIGICKQTMPPGSAGTTVWIDVAALGAGNRVYTTYTGVRPVK